MVAKVGYFEIVNGNKCAVPAGAEFHLGDAANCLSRMVDSGREVLDERGSFLPLIFSISMMKKINYE